MRIRDVLRMEEYFGFPRLEKEILLAFLLGENREYLYSHDDQELTVQEFETFRGSLKKMSQGYPLAYIIHEKEFYGRKFFVDERVLIPRPETEEIVEEVFRWSKMVYRDFQLDDKRKNLFRLDSIGTTNDKRILDLGTGSGCIPITFFLEGFTNVCASDISQEAIEVAQLNAQRFSVSVEFRCGNLLEPWEEEEIDVLVANLPYVEQDLVVDGLLGKASATTEPQTTDLSSNLKYEPSLALYAGEDGLDVYRELLLQLKKRMQVPEFFLFEAGMENTALLCELCQQNLPDISWKVKKDLGGRDRFVIGEK